MAVSVHLTLPELGCIGLYIPSALGMSLGPQDVPRPSGHILGLGKSLGRQRCKCQYIPPLVSVCIHSPSKFQKVCGTTMTLTVKTLTLAISPKGQGQL